MNFSRSTIYKI